MTLFYVDGVGLMGYDKFDDDLVNVATVNFNCACRGNGFIYSADQVRLGFKVFDDLIDRGVSVVLVDFSGVTDITVGAVLEFCYQCMFRDGDLFIFPYNMFGHVMDVFRYTIVRFGIVEGLLPSFGELFDFDRRTFNYYRSLSYGIGEQYLK